MVIRLRDRLGEDALDLLLQTRNQMVACSIRYLSGAKPPVIKVIPSAGNRDAIEVTDKTGVGMVAEVGTSITSILFVIVRPLVVMLDDPESVETLARDRLILRRNARVLLGLNDRVVVNLTTLIVSIMAIVVLVVRVALIIGIVLILDPTGTDTVICGGSSRVGPVQRIDIPLRIQLIGVSLPAAVAHRVELHGGRIVVDDDAVDVVNVLGFRETLYR
jgi:hypothetical protein